MSNDLNDKLLEEAYEMAEEFSGTPLGESIDFNIKRGDLEALYPLVRQARQMLVQEEMSDVE